MFRVAKDLGRTVHELGEEMSWTELLEWGVYYNTVEKNRLDKQDAYLAQIAYHVCGNQKTKLNNFLLKFGKKDTQKGIKLDGKQLGAVLAAAFGAKIVKDKK